MKTNAADSTDMVDNKELDVDSGERTSGSQFLFATTIVIVAIGAVWSDKLWEWFSPFFVQVH